jgi:Asp-tRNA(Asn)/Glu-tRNA(Gln) amidotransferase B subunit
MKESAPQKTEHENILKTKNIDYNSRGCNLLEQSTEPDIGPQFIAQYHRNKFAGNKPA